jgi:hypothetical protein
MLMLMAMAKRVVVVTDDESHTQSKYSQEGGVSLQEQGYQHQQQDSCSNDSMQP